MGIDIMKKIRIITFVIILAIVSIIIIIKFAEVKILTGEKSSLVKATIIMEPTRKKPQAITVEDKEVLDKIYDLIQQSHDKKVNRYPNHSDSMQFDSKFEIELLYKDGKVDLISSTENVKRIFRHLNTKGSSGDSGYISGTSEYLWDFLNTIKGQN